MNLEFNPKSYSDRQSALNAFSRTIKTIIRQEEPRSFHHEQMVLTLLELAKNTFDHSNGVGMLNIQMPSNETPLSVTYRDTGDAFNVDVCSEFGVSSKLGNGTNFGMGLGLILAGADGAGFDLKIERIDGATEFRLKLA